MKTYYYILILALIVISTALVPEKIEKNQKTNEPESIDKSRPAVQKGMITIKLKEGVGEYGKQNRNVRFNIPSLDEKVDKFQVNLLEKRFHYNPEKMRKSPVDLSRIYRIEFPESIPVTKVAREFSSDPNIEYAEPVPVAEHCAIPNDSLYVDLQYLPQIWAEQAWDIHKGENGSEEVVIAIVDAGVDWDHEDLVDNIWQNLGEDLDGDGKTLEYTGSAWVFDPDDENGVDDDSNGYVDDFIGWNFYTSGNNPEPLTDHGTHCAGLAGGTTNNNTGIASIGWNLKIMSLQASEPGVSISLGMDGIIYAAENGADVISNSWSANFYSLANHEAITYAAGLGSIIVAAAGNDNHFQNHYPADYPGVISVAAVDTDDYKATFSNFGPNIGVSAPGTQIISTVPGNLYQSWGGTSMATPIAAGLFGLVKSYHPDWTADQVITQVLATADDIDAINPGYENLLGSGRINAYRALNDTGVSPEQEISVELISSVFHDSDSNNTLEPGDTACLSFKLRNYNYGVSCDNANFSLITDDTSIIILDDTCSADIPADDFFTLDHVFKFKIINADSTCFVKFNLITTANVAVTWGDTNTFEVPVAPQGILVYEGEGFGNAFSGDYINEFLVEQGHQVFYTSQFPSSLNGFDAVFLSYGNYGIQLQYGVFITQEMTEAMTGYLINGGNIYIECGSLFGGIEYLGYPNLQEIMELFGVMDFESPQTSNSISLLSGLPGSICENLAFTGSTQSPNWYIDIMTPDENGIAALEEDDYGIVAVQGEGEYGQRTFCFAYALAHLEDGTQGTREELLTEIVDFLLFGVGVEEPLIHNEELSIDIYPNPCSETAFLRFKTEDQGFVISNLYSVSGRLIKRLMNKEMPAGTHEIEVDVSDLQEGVYFMRVLAGNESAVRKLVVVH